MTGFPVNVIDELIISLTTFMPDHVVLDRTLRYEDPARSVGVFAVDLTPDNENSSFLGQPEPAINKYTYRIQNMVKATSEGEGRAFFSLDSKTIRVILYRDSELLLRLSSLNEILMNTRETFKRFSLIRQRFLNNELSRGKFVYLAMTDILVETDISKL